MRNTVHNEKNGPGGVFEYNVKDNKKWNLCFKDITLFKILLLLAGSCDLNIAAMFVTGRPKK